VSFHWNILHTEVISVRGMSVYYAEASASLRLSAGDALGVSFAALLPSLPFPSIGQEVRVGSDCTQWRSLPGQPTRHSLLPALCNRSSPLNSPTFMTDRSSSDGKLLSFTWLVLRVDGDMMPCYLHMEVTGCKLRSWWASFTAHMKREGCVPCS
jgi:hypothetical protein